MISIFLAKVLGPYLVLVCLSVLINRRSWKVMVDSLESNLQMYVSGALILILGLMMVNVHNIWTLDYRGVITFLGWLTIFKGVVRVFWGERAVKWGRSAFHSSWYIPLIVVFLVIGLWLTAVGYAFIS